MWASAGDISVRTGPWVDVHAHVLPCFDDGPATVEESLALCRALQRQGVAVVVATPHWQAGRTENHAQIESAAILLQQRCNAEGIDLTVLPGADVRLTPELVPAVRAGHVMTLARSGTHLLLELPVGPLPPLERVAFELQTAGVTPVITHPERHEAFVRRPHAVEQVVEAGCLVQVCAGSLVGEFGKAARRAAEWFVKRGLAWAVASDAHHAEGPRSPRLAEAAARVRRLCGEEVVRRLFCENPSAVLPAEVVHQLFDKRGEKTVRARAEP